MDQKKIGGFLKELRNQKGLTQEQLAEQFCVSSRTISRWENGNNMPDLDILIEISDFYEVDLREILNGERKSENMDKEMKETVLQAVDYTNTEAERYNKCVRICNAIAILLMLGYTILKDSSIYNDNSNVMAGIEFAQGMAIGMLFVGLVMSSRYGAKIRAFKQRLLKKNVINLMK
ncbi:MAG: helix-turn-helix domain-containing protein [Lachnospiraceae bacterium]